MTLTGNEQSEQDVRRQQALRQRGALPRHVAIIMDGNGRWARERGAPRVRGHQEGVASVRDVVESCAQLGIEYLTLYTFSTENWERPAQEVNALMKLLIRTIRKERDRLIENNIRLRAIGALDKLPDTCAVELDHAIRETERNTRMTLTLALSYSGRWEIIQAVRHLARRVQQGHLDPEDIDEVLFAEALSDMPDPDLLIRTGGEFRISNFLLWQLAYTELHITDCFWPSFRREQLYDAIRDFQDRERRFGRVLEGEE